MANTSLTDIQVSATNRLLEALQKSENQMRRRINLLVEVVFELNTKGEIVYSNDAWQKNLGYKSVVGTQFSDYIHPLDLDVFQSAILRYDFDKGQQSKILIRFKHSAGHILSMYANVVSTESGIVGALHDVTEQIQTQKILEETIFEKNQLLKSMATLFKSNSMGSLVSSLAHEINSPLGSISINSELLKMDLKEYVERHQLDDLENFQLIVDQIFEATQKAGLVVTRLRSLFTHGEDKFELFDLSMTISDIFSLLNSEFINEKIVLNSKVEKNLIIYGDPSQIQMVIINALKNSIDSVKNTSNPRVVNFEALKIDDQTRVVISDSGSGFNDSILKSGFELFKTSKPNGMGVGMWLSRAIMENHNGSINATNNPEGGACITLIFYDKKLYQADHLPS